MTEPWWSVRCSRGRLYLPIGPVRRPRPHRTSGGAVDDLARTTVVTVMVACGRHTGAGRLYQPVAVGVDVGVDPVRGYVPRPPPSDRHPVLGQDLVHQVGRAIGAGIGQGRHPFCSVPPKWNSRSCRRPRHLLLSLQPNLKFHRRRGILRNTF